MENLQLPLAEKTNIKKWAFEDLNLSGTPADFDISTLDVTGNTIVIVDGQIVHKSLEDALVLTDDLKTTLHVENKLTVLNKASRNASLSVVVAKNTKIETPLKVFNIAKGRSLVSKIEVVLEDGAELEMFEYYIGESKMNANLATNIVVGKNAKLIMNTISEMAADTVVYHHKHAEVDADGSIDTTNFVINDADIVFEDLTYLNGRGSNGETKTIALASGNQKQNFTVRVESIGDHSIGNMINYGIVKDTAHLAFNGVGKIQKNAKRCDNQQETRMLNLSRTAEAVVNPFLLIDEGDITAGHAATIGQLNEEQIYYLMSRGLTREESAKAIVSGFLAPFVDALEDDVLKEKLTAKIQQKLG